MRRRDFIRLLVGSALWPLAVRAQQSERMRRIGVLMGATAKDPEAQGWFSAFQHELKALGWIDGSNVLIDVRWVGADPSRMRAFAAEVIRLAPDVIVANTPPVLAAVQQETRSLPIVFIQVGDPVGAGFVQSLARPGGNTTGFTNFEFAMGQKWLEILKEMAPAIRRVGVVLMPEHEPNAGQLRVIEAAASSFGVQVTPAGGRDDSAMERAIEAFAREPPGGLIVLPSPISTSLRELIVAVAARHRLPAVYPFRFFVVSGGLMSYGPEQADLFWGAASYVDRILKGEKPGELPVQQPTKFELIINLKTAKVLGLTVPATLLARADEVIE